MSFFSRKRHPSVQVQQQPPSQPIAYQQQREREREHQLREQQLKQQQREQAAREAKERELLEKEREAQREKERVAVAAAAAAAKEEEIVQQAAQKQQQQQQQPPHQQPSQQQQQAPSTQPPSSTTAPPPSSGPRPAYPWSARKLQLQPPSYLSRPPVPIAVSPSPFPRYGHSLPPITTASGEVFLFGGLVREQVKNDLYSFSIRDLSATLIETVGEIPPPRVGHASAIVSSVLIVWGGDTKSSDNDKQDQGLYLLNLGTREWTRVSTIGPAPLGRYGHAVTMVATRFFVFGGQVDGEFLNDLWAFDLSSLKSTPQWEHFVPVASSDMPARRTGHACVTFGDKIYLFGGTDGQYHYNDTWSFDVATRTWKEITCIGFLPVPREGHASALVDDVMYVFGGRGVDGKDLGDLAAFKISNSRWYMFHNMGPSPSGRSGHAMASHGSKVLVLGGESFTASKPDDPSIIHVLDTRHIKYPDSSRLPSTPANQGSGRRPSVTANNPAAPHASHQQPQPPPADPPVSQSPPNNPPPVSRAMSPQSIGQRAMSPQTTIRERTEREKERVAERTAERIPERVTSPQSIAQRAVSPSSTPASGQRSMSPSTAPTPQPQRTVSPTTTITSAEDSRRTGSPSGRSVPNGSTYPSMGTGGAALAASSTQPNGPVSGQINGIAKQAKPTQPPTSNSPAPARPRREDDTGYVIPERVEEDVNGANSSIESHTIVSGSISSRDRALSPNGVDHPRTVSPSNGRDPITATNPAVTRLNGLSARSPSPVAATPPPSDAFYYSGPSGGGRSPVPGMNGLTSHSRAGSASNITADLLKSKEAELETLKRREHWMRAALAQATKAGFVWSSGELDDAQVGSWTDEALGHNSPDLNNSAKTVAATIIKMKQEHAKMQTAMIAQARSVSDRLAEADRLRNAAIQDTAFYRAKLSSYESGLVGDIHRIDRDRIAQLESQVQALSSEKVSFERKFEEVSESNALQTQLREQVEDRLSDSTKRAEAAEEAHENILGELTRIQEKHHSTEITLRDHMDRVFSLTSTSQQLEAENRALRLQVSELVKSREQHQRALDQAQTALDSANARADEVEAQYGRAREQLSHLEAELVDLRNEMETRTQEAASTARRLADVENSWARSREEADSYRALTTGGLGQLLDTQRELLANEDRATRGHAEKMQAMELEASSLRKMLKEAGTRVDAAQSELASQRGRVHSIETESMVLRSQLVGLRSQLAVALADGGRLRKDLALRDNEVREKSRMASEAEIRLGMLRNFLAENGIAIDESELASGQPLGGGRLRELENKLQQRIRQHEDTELRLQSTIRRQHDAESQVNMLTSELDRLKSVRSPSNSEDATRVAILERKFAESEANHKEKMQQMEADYQTAVHYVKGTEKMLRRMKDELTKQKSLNQTLQSELDGVRGVNGSEAGSRTRNASGRNTPLAEEEALRNQLAESQRQVQRLNLDNQELHQQLEMLRAEIDQLKNDLDASQQQSEVGLQQVDDLQGKVDQLENALKVARDGQDDGLPERLARENRRLKDENQMLMDKINLVLELDQPGLGRDRPTSTLSARRASHSSSENAMAFESLSNELDDWQRRLASSASSHRPMSEYDEPRHVNSDRLR